MYVVAGITGNTGKIVASELLARGLRVRGLTRDASRVPPQDGLEVVELDLIDVGALTRAMAGADGAYLLLPPSWPAVDYAAYAKPIIDSLAAAVRGSDIPRVVVLSSVGVQHPSGTGPIVVLHTLERALSGHPGVTFLRPGYFHENLAVSVEPARSGSMPVFFDLDKPVHMVATRDIGEEAARQLVVPGPDSAPVVNLAGPEDLSFREVAARFAKVLGHAVEPQPLPNDAIVQPLKAMGAGQIAVLYGEMNSAIDAGLLAFESSAPVLRGTIRLEETLANLVR